MTNEELAAAIVSELSLAYMQSGSHISADNALQVAKSYCEEMDFRDLTEVHEAFRRAKTVADIPTQRTLSEALKNYRAETLTPKTDAPAIEYKDQRAAWLPKTEIERAKNQRTALRNLCAALGDKEYQEFCRSHLSKKVGDHYEFVDKARATAFAVPKKALMRELYKRYWRNLPIAQGFPAGAMLHDGLIPPTVPEFREMLRLEAERAAMEF